MGRYFHLPAELSYELAQFVPGPYCRKSLISSCFLFYNLLSKSKRALFWKIETIAEHESHSVYRFPNGNEYRALSPRNATHRHMARFIIENLDNVGQFLRRANGMLTILVSMRTTGGQYARNWMNNFLESDATGLSIAGHYNCEFTHARLGHNYEWDVCTITWHNKESAVDNWNQLFHYLLSVLRTVDNGNVPLAINGV